MREQEKCPNCGAPPDRHDWRTNEVSGYACGSLPGKSTLKRPMCEYAASLRSKLRNVEHVMQTLHSQRLSGKLGLEGTAILEMLSGETGVFVAELEVQHDLALKRAEALARAKERDTIAEEDNE